jgi:hypothetical protein
VTDAALVLKTDRAEVACSLADTVASPDLLTLKGALADPKAGLVLFNTLQHADSAAFLQVTVSCEVATPVVNLRLAVDRTKTAELLELRVKALGGRVTVTELDQSVRELVREKVVMFTVDGTEPGDPTAKAWLTELAVKRFAGVLKEQVLIEAKPHAEPRPEQKPEPATFAWDQIKVRQFQSVTGDVTGKYSSVISFRHKLTIPVKELKLAEHKAGFLDLRGK